MFFVSLMRRNACRSRQVLTETIVNSECDVTEKYFACIAALGQTDPRDDREALDVSDTAKVACRWILDDCLFQTWANGKDRSARLTWASEPTETGRTNFAVCMSEYLEQRDPHSRDSLVLYYFCSDQVGDRNSAASILKGLISMLGKKWPRSAASLHYEYCINRDALFDRHSINTLWRVFQQMVDKIPVANIFCIIDGIDVCDEKDLQAFLKKLVKHFSERKQRLSPDPIPNNAERGTSCLNDQGGSTTDFRMLLLGQPALGSMAQALGSFPRLSLSNESSEAGRAAWNEYVEARAVDVASKLGKKKPNIQTTHMITESLNQGEGQSFLWVDLVGKQMMNMSKTQLRKFTKAMPTTTEGLHMQTLLRVPEKQRLSVSTMLKWIAFAERPLSPQELVKAVKYHLKTSFSVKSFRMAQRSCPGLALSRWRNVPHGKGVVRKEEVYPGQGLQKLISEVRSPLRSQKEFAIYVCERSDVHSELANTCVAYLEQSANLQKSRRVRLKPGDQLKPSEQTFVDKHPFLEYAIAHWTDHAKAGSIEKMNYDVPFFTKKAPRRDLWWQSYWISLRRRLAWKWTTPGNFSLLHLAGYFGIVSLALHVERQQPLSKLLSTEDHQGMKPINWATERSQAAMVEFLLQRGEFDNEALRQAARTGEVNIVRMLLENRDKVVDSPELASPAPSPLSAPFTPLQSIRKATLRSVSDFSKNLDHVKDERTTPLLPSSTGYGKTKSETPLHIAAACGHHNVIDTLLKAGEDYNAPTDGGWTPLHVAAWFGRIQVLKCLITAGADPRAETKEKLTPLHCAARNSQSATVDFMLSRSIGSVEAGDRYGYTPFHLACKCQDLGVMQILLKHGANLECRLRSGWTPLMSASREGSFAVVEQLIRHGADVNAKWIHVHEEAGVTVELCALDLAVMYKHDRVARLLSDSGGTKRSNSAQTQNGLAAVNEATEDEYDLPERPDIVFIDFQSPESDGDEVSGPDSSLETEDEHGSEAGESDMDASSRAQSTTATLDAAATTEHGSTGVEGLGISGGVENVALYESDAPITGLPVEPPTPTVDHVRTYPDPLVSGEEQPTAPGSTNWQFARTLSGSDTFGQVFEEPKSIATGPDQVADADAVDQRHNSEPTPVVNQISDKRASSTPKLPGSLGTLFDRVASKKSSSGKECNAIATSEKKVDAPAPTGSIAENGDATGCSTRTEGPDLGEDESRGEGLLGRFKTTRAFSWKK